MAIKTWNRLMLILEWWNDRVVSFVIIALVVHIVVDYQIKKPQREIIDSIVETQHTIMQTQFTIITDQETLEKRITTLEKQRNWVLSSQQGKCHDDIQRLITKTWNINPLIMTEKQLYNFVMAESTCNPFKESSKGGRGLLQVTRIAAQEVGVDYEDMFDPELNLLAGYLHLKRLLESTGNLHDALTAYNWGGDRFRNGVTTGEFARKVLQ